MAALPFQIIQAPMGVAVSSWRLARAVSSPGQLGVVAGSAIETVLTRRLQCGDQGGHVRRALTRFPFPDVAERIVQRYFRRERRPADAFLDPPAFEFDTPRDLLELAVAANFVEVFLAKEGHNGPAGMNYLEKLQLPLLPSIYGAMLAGVDYLLISAGPPRDIACAIEAFAAGRPASYPVSIINPHVATQRATVEVHFDPRAIFAGGSAMKRPRLLAVISSPAQAASLAGVTSIDGLILQRPDAGGHTAPHARPHPEEFSGLKRMQIPFFLAGGQGHPGKLREALSLGAAGIQVGTAFEFCEESGLATHLKRTAIALARPGAIQIKTDLQASPTGFALKILELENSLSAPAEYQRRRRICDLAHMRRPLRLTDGTIAYRCPAEPLADYIAKGGLERETSNKRCLCNAMFANIDLATPRGADEQPELPLVSASEDAQAIFQFVPPNATSYSAADVLRLLLA